MARLLIALCVINFGLCFLDQGDPLRVLSNLLGSGFDTSVVVRFGALGGRLGRVEPFRYVSAIFVHFSILHLVLNMLALLQLSLPVERSLGSSRMLVVFGLSGALGFVASDLYYGVAGAPTAGASGGVFGLIGAFIAELQVRKDPALKEILLRVIAFSLAFLLFFSVNNAAHVGGFAVGYALGHLFERERRRDRHQGFFLTLSALFVLSSVASIALSTQSPYWQQLRREEVRQGLR